MVTHSTAWHSHQLTDKDKCTADRDHYNYSVNIQILSVSKHFLSSENSAVVLRYMASYKADYISGSPIFAENF